jgi:IS30 family transposase
MGISGPLRRVQRGFWQRIAAGDSTAVAAGWAGVSKPLGEVWFRQAGGMSPLSLEEPSGRFLSITEREEILRGITRGDSIRRIAAVIGRQPSTVLRELRRNRGAGPTYRAKWRRQGRAVTRGVLYSPSVAQRRADRRLTRPKPSRLAADERLRLEVTRRLRMRQSPQQIMQRLRVDFPDDQHMRISHESIYRSLYVQGRGELRRELTACLRSGRAVRKPRARGRRRAGNGGPGRIPGMIMISDRPAEVEDRAVPGHWEGDLILGKNSKSQIGTLVERSTRFVILLHLPGGKDATTVADAMITQMRRLPEHLRRSVTWDQGKEMSQHVRVAAELDCGVYFCDPHAPWQRGSNENTNGLLRQYFPKSTDLTDHTLADLNHVADELNDRPRMTLDWHTPREALDRLLSNPPQAGVALTP